jgi:phosphomannomutase
LGGYDYCGGVVVSASLNPLEYIGLKMVGELVAYISSETGLFDIREWLKAGKDAEVSSDKIRTLT